MEVHLMYGIQGFIRYTYLDEVALVCGDEDFERILTGMFKAFAEKLALTDILPGLTLIAAKVG